MENHLIDRIVDEVVFYFLLISGLLNLRTGVLHFACIDKKKSFRNGIRMSTRNKQYITVDNRYMLLYTVCCKGGSINMHMILNHSSMVPIYEQLMEQIKTGIIESALTEGEALPSVRKLAGELRISALTVKKAYDKLEEAGFVTTVHGKGTFVAASDKQLALEARRRAVEEEFEKAIDQAKNVGLSNDEILEIVTLLLDEA